MDNRQETATREQPEGQTAKKFYLPSQTKADSWFAARASAEQARGTANS